ncbi:kinase, pfkB family [Reticulomyxa filosa]|uniref:Kinase, pfkB family n=1 Tax=Reticulomyxa filosa TaxID=46433 RepID=X6PBT9_RETFI|nr:kinase, pfkB family [Reticulomyxa filosa]|eukprot:ETO35646.1 kinase, pfkB family [Reticulomyxa filosa]
MFSDIQIQTKQKKTAEIGNHAQNKKEARQPVIIGGMIIDVIARVTEKVKPKHYNSGIVQYVRGGVGRNIAESLARLGHRPRLISAVADDNPGLELLEHCNQLMIDTTGVHVWKHGNVSTSSFMAIYNENRDLHVAVADLTILEKTLTIQYLAKFENWIKNAPMLVIDGNLTPRIIQFILSLCFQESGDNVPVWYVPISVEKAVRVVNDQHRLDGITYISPNVLELWKFLKILNKNGCTSTEKIEEYARWLVERGAQNVAVTLGELGAMVVNRNQSQYFEAVPIENRLIQTTCGAGDNLAAGTICGILDGKPLLEAIQLGLKAAKSALLVTGAVNPLLSRQLLQKPEFSLQKINTKLCKKNFAVE